MPPGKGKGAGRHPMDDALFQLVSLLKRRHPPSEVLNRAGDALDALEREAAADEAMLLDTAALRALLPFIKGTSAGAAQAALRAVTSLVSGDASGRAEQVANEHGVMAACAQCLRSGNLSTAYEAALAMRRLVFYLEAALVTVEYHPGIMDTMLQRFIAGLPRDLAAEAGLRADSGVSSTADITSEAAIFLWNVACAPGAARKMLRRPQTLSALAAAMRHDSLCVARAAAAALMHLLELEPLTAPEAAAAEAAGHAPQVLDLLLLRRGLALKGVRALLERVAREAPPLCDGGGGEGDGDLRDGLGTALAKALAIVKHLAAAAPPFAPGSAGAWGSHAVPVLRALMLIEARCGGAGLTDEGDNMGVCTAAFKTAQALLGLKLGPRAPALLAALPARSGGDGVRSMLDAADAQWAHMQALLSRELLVAIGFVQRVRLCIQRMRSPPHLPMQDLQRLVQLLPEEVRFAAAACTDVGKDLPEVCDMLQAHIDGKARELSESSKAAGGGATTAPRALRRCAGCDAGPADGPGVRLRRCAGCGQVTGIRYCSRECARVDWKYRGHRRVCEAAGREWHLVALRIAMIAAVAAGSPVASAAGATMTTAAAQLLAQVEAITAEVA